MKWYLKCFKQYADFNGRARRTEYWMFALFNVIFIFLIIIIGTLLGSALLGDEGAILGAGLYVLYLLAMIIPSIAVGVRRLHDTGNSGWMLLVGIIPIIGGIWIFILTVIDSKPGENKWGPNPKGN